ncbi:hypothetical protein FFK22_009015 [Mycobacterium sp. KBS0706]|uniref:hypothetical protein n=1 Tax=Mycobacterium sp. KBS0706 TaxID=2578109 RepID=UPI00110FC062|nr:hypothetical protein [Mycobacterium sp. KBS0706]TSD89108.1 hypothetical protein FFK22_009015 [Mycobacterium sp. KBS0706]
MSWNRKLIEDAKPIFADIAKARRRVQDAQSGLELLERKLVPRLADLAGVPPEELKATNISCMAPDVRGHVYHGRRDAEPGLGHRRCIFCGIDDFTE